MPNKIFKYKKIQIFTGIFLSFFIIYTPKSFSEIKYNILKNGIGVIIKEDKRNKVVAIETWIKGGSSIEDKNNYGISHLIEHMLFKGTKNRTGEEINKQIKSKGGYFNAATSYDYTKYYIVMPSGSYKTALEIESDILKNSLFRENDIKNEINVVLEERKRRIDDPESYLWTKFMEDNENNYPYKNPIIGYYNSINKLNRETIINYVNSKYNSRTIYLVIVGDINAKEVMKDTEKLFGDILEGKEHINERYNYSKGNNFKYSQIKNNQTKTYILMGYKIPKLDCKDTYALEVLADIIGGGRSSRLYQKLISDEVLADYIDAGVFSGKYPGYILISGRMQPERTKLNINKIYEEINNILENGVTEEEINTAISRIETNYIESKEDYSEEGDLIGYYTLIRDYKFADEYIKNLTKVTREEVISVARKYLNLKNCKLFISYPKHLKNNILPGRRNILETYSKTNQKSFNKNEYAKYKVFSKDFKEKEKTNNVKAKIFNLIGGAKLILLEDKSLPVVSINTARIGGFINENENNNGITKLMQKMILRGNKNMKRKDIELTLDKIGAKMYPICDMNKMGLSSYVLKRNFKKAMKTYFESLFYPVFKQEEIDKAKIEIINEIKGKEDDMENYSEEKARAMLFDNGHPYHFSIDGTEESIKKIDRNDLIKWHSSNYLLNGLVISVAGDIEEEVLLKLINSYILEYKNSVNNLFNRDTKLSAENKAVITSGIDREREQTTLVYNCLGPSVISKDYYPFKLFNVVMNGLGGRIFKRLREEEGLVYDAYCYLDQALGTGIFKIIVSCDPKNENKVKKKIIDMFNDIKLNGITIKEFVEAKQYYKGILLITMQTNNDKSRAYLSNQLIGKGYKNTELLPSVIDNISKKDIESSVKKYINFNYGAWFIVRSKNKK